MNASPSGSRFEVFPAILVGSTIIQQQQAGRCSGDCDHVVAEKATAGLTAQASSSRPKSENEDDPQNVVLQVLLEMQVDPEFKLAWLKGETSWGPYLP